MVTVLPRLSVRDFKFGEWNAYRELFNFPIFFSGLSDCEMRKNGNVKKGHKATILGFQLFQILRI